VLVVLHLRYEIPCFTSVNNYNAKFFKFVYVYVCLNELSACRGLLWTTRYIVMIVKSKLRSFG